MGKTGLIGAWSQNILLLLGVIAFYLTDELEWLVYVFLSMVVLSRISLWTFDLVEVQILQENILEHQRGVVNSVEQSLTNLATLIAFGVGTIFSRPEQFWILVLFSYFCISGCAILFTIWYTWKNKKVSPFDTNGKTNF